MNKTNLIFLLLVIIFIYLSLDFQQDDGLKVNFLDIGQGDGIYISYDDLDMVIDGGPDNLLLHELSQVMPWWDREIDYLVISHFHADHMMGFVELLNKYKVKNILVTAHQPDDHLYKIFIAKAGEKGVKIIRVEAGQKFIVNQELYWQILLADDYHEDYNENSMVIKLNYKDQHFLFTGDLGFEGEGKLLLSGFNLNSQYLKIGHHGSKYSSSLDFLQEVNPEFCIIQSGKNNKFNHPHPATIDRLKNIPCQIMDTQASGRITLEID